MTTESLNSYSPTDSYNLIHFPLFCNYFCTFAQLFAKWLRLIDNSFKQNNCRIVAHMRCKSFLLKLDLIVTQNKYISALLINKIIYIELQLTFGLFECTTRRPVLRIVLRHVHHQIRVHVSRVVLQFSCRKTYFSVFLIMLGIILKRAYCSVKYLDTNKMSHFDINEETATRLVVLAFDLIKIRVTDHTCTVACT